MFFPARLVIFIQSAKVYKTCPNTPILALKSSFLSRILIVVMESVNLEFTADHSKNGKAVFLVKKKKIFSLYIFDIPCLYKKIHSIGLLIIFEKMVNMTVDWLVGQRISGLECQFVIKTVAFNPFFDASGNQNIGATICIGRDIWCLPNAGFSKFGYLWKIYLIKIVYGF